MKPVAVGEAQEDLPHLADLALEALDRIGIVDVQALEGAAEAVGHHQQGRLVQVRKQEQQEVLVAEVFQQAAARV